MSKNIEKTNVMRILDKEKVEYTHHRPKEGQICQPLLR